MPASKIDLTAEICTSPAPYRVRSLVVDFFPPEQRMDRSVEHLAKILADFICATELRRRLEAFVDLKDWANAHASSSGKVSRLETLLRLMESQCELRTWFQFGTRRVLTETRSVELFAEAGLHPRDGLWSEAVRRLVAEVLPSAREDTDLSKFVFRLYPTSQDIDRLVSQPDDVFERLARLLAPVDDAIAWSKQREDLMQAFLLLGVHVVGIGLSPALRSRSHHGGIEESPFYQLQQATSELIHQNGAAPILESWRKDAARCREEMEYVHQHMEDTGVSTALVFDMATIEHAIARMESIAEVLFVAQVHESIGAVKRLLEDVMNARRADRSVRALFRENASLLARKVVERTGKAGEPYIASSRSEYRSIWKASLGGGLLTVLTAAIKMRITERHSPPFVEGIIAGTNYAASFILLQCFHLALATKQPSVTAATFAGIVRSSQGQTRQEKVVEFVARITSSQLASAAGNILAVCVGCLLFARLWALVFRRPYLPIPRAEYVYRALDPFASGTMIFAGLTGVILWISALAGGWVENFAAFNRVPEAIAQHPLGNRLGRQRMKKVSDAIEANLSGWTTSVVLGYLLGFVPAMGVFFGIPLDVRHVTLNTGTLVLAAASFGRGWLYRGWFIYTVLGIAVTFVLNLGVSFFIAASVALRAYGVSRQERVSLMRYSLRSFLKSPRRFLLPPPKDRRQEMIKDIRSGHSREGIAPRS